jgi:hypothetical protein
MFVLAVDEEHAWKVSGRPEHAKKTCSIAPAFWAEGVLLSGLPEGFPRPEGKIIDMRALRKWKSKPCKDVPQEAPIGASIRGAEVTPNFEHGESEAVIMIGCGVTREHLDPYLQAEPDAEVWTMNDDRHPRSTRHFQIHLREFFGHYGEECFDVSDLDIYVYDAENYPYNKIRRIWLNSSIDYMMAIADKDGFKRIYLPGFDFGGKREGEEADSFKYWVGAAEGRGAKVFLSPLFHGFDCDVYGLNEDPNAP